MYGHAGNGVDIWAAVLMAFGFQITGVEFLGGLFLALAGALSASRILAAGMIKNAIPLGVFGTVVTGLFVAFTAALLTQALAPEWPVQLAMGCGGFLSSFIAPFFLKVAAGVSSRSDKVSQRLVNRVLPGDGED